MIICLLLGQDSGGQLPALHGGGLCPGEGGVGAMGTPGTSVSWEQEQCSGGKEQDPSNIPKCRTHVEMCQEPVRAVS